MSPLSAQILQLVETLPAKDQQQILDFVEFLWEKHQQGQPHSLMTAPEASAHQSLLEVAQASIGTGEGPGDLSTNPNYMQGYGQ